MSDKICGECRYMLHKDTFEVCTHSMAETSMFDKACKHFAPPTNGDVIRQGGDRALADFAFAVEMHRCSFCAYFAQQEALCQRPNDKLCSDGLKEWLNAPAESEGKDE